MSGILLKGLDVISLKTKKPRSTIIGARLLYQERDLPEVGKIEPACSRQARTA
ncbi:hypothetical protein [Algoriphagus taiwanensis]|uniref:Uncharacterized protein n=1 Tax=Algoriphagus taiwanensis TaxID=1445656 RepID=A0ABQ6Q122_9BACT|nr:hypothetical protein Ataiwa_21760 [Algoriphagus taiwanensis]